jgi:KaiC/GvpD/RAD55 family RecA-like ATPase
MLDAKDFVQGVLIEGSSAVVYGESNAGKTFWTVDLALHVAAGMEWNGRRIEQGGVVYCALEGSAGFLNRVCAWKNAHEIVETNIPFTAVPAALNLLDPEADTPRLINAIKRASAGCGMPVKMVVIDTLSRAMAGGNENAPDDMGALVRNMDQIRQECKVCVLFVHHSGKDAAKGARGHSLLRAAIDTEIEVRTNDVSGQKSALVVKQRELKKGDVFRFSLDVIRLGKNQHGEDVTTCVVAKCEGAAPAYLEKKLSRNESTLWHLMDGLTNVEHGRTGSKTPMESGVATLSRSMLWNELAEKKWLRVSGKKSDCRSILKSERTRLWKCLEALRNNGLIEFDRKNVSLLQRPSFCKSP